MERIRTSRRGQGRQWPRGNWSCRGRNRSQDESCGGRERNGMLRVSPFLLTATFVCGFAAAAPPADIKGVLMDQMCSGKADLRISGATGNLVGGRIVAEAHT